MSQKEQNKREVAFAALGQLVVNNEAYQQAMTARKAQIFDVFCKTKQDQTDVREEAWRTMKNMEALEKWFEHLLNTGKMAEQSLKAIDEQ